MIQKDIQDKHFEKAARDIDRNGVPAKRKSREYDVIIGGNKYPPKYLISKAAEFAFGTAHPANKFTAREAIKYMRARKYFVRRRKAIFSDDEESRFPEGKKKYRLHRKAERDRSVVIKAKEKRLAEVDELICDVCDFSFLDKYGTLGEGFIEAHHKIPVSELDGSKKTKISDLALVCSNCHRMLHRALVSVEYLRKLLNTTT